MKDPEAVDSSNVGKPVGDGKQKPKNEAVAAEKTEAEMKKEAVPPKIRPTASDFFEDTKPSTPAAKNDGVWRRKTSAHVAENEERLKVAGVKEENTARTFGSAPIVRETALPHPVPHARMRPHTEASMSAIDDVMSRIKGAIDGMQASGAASKENRLTAETEQPPPRTSSTSGKRERWLPPPRPRTEEKLEELREPLSTSKDPSYSPASTETKVQLPKVSHYIEPVPRRQLNGFSKPPPPARFELLSFVPPVQGMNKRDFTVNSALFRQPPPSFKGSRIRVALPRSKSGPMVPRTVSMGGKYGNLGAFGKQTNADGVTSWRRGPSVRAEEKEEEKEGVSSEKDKGGVGVQDQESKPPAKQQEEPHTHTRTRQPKMPAGSVVAFIRDSRIDVVEADPKPLVNFIVTSELDELTVEPSSGVSGASNAEVVSQTKDESGTSPGSSSGAPLLDGAKAGTETNATQSSSSPSANSKVSESKSADDSVSNCQYTTCIPPVS